jgi:SAM-dependent methyltransferase
MHASSLHRGSRRLLPASRTTRPHHHHHYYYRTFFSFFTQHAEATPDEKEEEAQLLDRTFYRMSLQHAHPRGPWPAMVAAVVAHAAAGPADASLHVLDLACGPRGEPGTTIARALPSAAVVCTDACVQAVAAVLVATSTVTEDHPHHPHPPTAGSQRRLTPPPNLTKAVADLTDLSHYPAGSFDVITCCYGYGLAPNVTAALAQAHRVLKPGGILVTATWQASSLVSSGEEVLTSVRGQGRTVHDDDEAFLPRAVTPRMALSQTGEWEGLLVAAGFTEPGAVVATLQTYPLLLGRTAADQFAMGTILVRPELERLGALRSCTGVGGWNNLAEEVFWTNLLRKNYTDMVDGDMLLRDNRFKLTVSTKRGERSSCL